MLRVSETDIWFTADNSEAFHPVEIAMDGVKSCRVTADPTSRVRNFLITCWLLTRDLAIAG